MRTTVWLLGLTLVLVVAGLAYIRITGLSALPAPGLVESRVARLVRGFAVPGDVRARTSPVAATSETLAEGMAHFADHCASCHANDGSGRVPMGRGLYPKAPDMRRPETQRLTDGELFWIIENGVRFTGMPGWSTGTAEGENDSWKLVLFIRHLPQLSTAELARMESLNPQSPESVRQAIEAEQFLQGGDSK